MDETTDLLIFWAVVGARFLVPLTIPRFPLPGVIAALILDAVDQTVSGPLPPRTGSLDVDQASRQEDELGLAARRCDVLGPGE